MALNSIYRVRTRGTLRGQRIEWGVHIQQVLASGGPADLAGSWVASVMPLVDAATSQEINWDDVLVSDTATAGSEQQILPLTQPHPGLVTGDCLPGQNAVVVSLRSGVKGRRRRGRFFLPGVSEANQANGLVTGSQLTAITALADGLRTHYGPTGSEASYRLVVYSPPTPPFKAPKPPPVHTDTLVTPVVALPVDPVIRTQRRRTIGVGQ